MAERKATLSTRVAHLEKRLEAQDKRLEDLELRHDEAQMAQDDVSLRELLLFYPTKLQGLAEALDVWPSQMTRLVRAVQPTFPIVMATQISKLFAIENIEPFGEPMTVERIRMAWLKEKGKP